MSPVHRNRLLWLLIALHPLWTVLRTVVAVRGPAGLESMGSTALGLDLLLTTAFTQLLALGTGRSDTPAKAPYHQPTVDGWSLTLSRYGRAAARLPQAALATLVSTLGWLVLMPAFELTVPVREIEYVGLTIVMLFVIPLYLGIGQGLLNTVALALRLWRVRDVAVALRGRRLVVGERQVHLSGTSTLVWGEGELRVRDGDEEVVLRGPQTTLQWIAEQVASIEPLGGEEDVPEGLRRLARQVETP